MKVKRIPLAACAAAILACSCTGQAELDKAKADTQAARAEVAQLRADWEAEKAAAKAKGDAEAKAKADTTAAAAAAKEAEAKALAELMARWNAVAAGVTVVSPPLGQVNFRWEADKFPHPTYKGGSHEAYNAFAKLLVAFLEQGDNFHFLAKNRLFTAELRYVLPSGQVGVWTFARLAEDLSKPAAVGMLDEDTRKTLQGLAERMRRHSEG